jgi:hypothetical protein
MRAKWAAQWGVMTMADKKRRGANWGSPKAKAKSADSGTLRDAHGKGISAESSYDLVDHVMAPKEFEGQVGSQSGPQPSAGQAGMRSQLGSFEAGQTDFGAGAPGEDVEAGEPPFIGVDPGRTMRKPAKGKRGGA